MTIGPDGYPHIKEFGNIKKSRSSQQDGSRDQLDPGIDLRIRGEREPLADINTTDKEIKVILEMPGVKKEDIRLDLHGNSLEIATFHGQRKYKRTLEIPSDADVDSARSTYNNGYFRSNFQ